MRPLLALLFALVTFTVTLTATSTATAQESYFPNRDGLSWTYTNGETQTLTGPRLVNGQSVMVLAHALDGVPVSEDYLLYSETGVLSLGTAAGGQTLVYTPPLVIYQGERLEVGDAWASTSQVGDLEITFQAEVVGVRGVSSPAGRFNTLQIRQTTVTSTGAQTTLDLFFVPTVGVVRTVTQDGTVVDLLEKNF